MSKAGPYARNLVANWVSHLGNLVVMFLLSPYVVHTLGQTDYGIWSLLNVLAGYMGVLDLGVRASTGRHIILYLGKADHDAVDKTIRTGLGFYSAVGFLLLLTGALLGSAFPIFFTSVPESSHQLLRLLLPLMAVNIWLSAFGAVCSSVLIAHDRFDLARAIDLVVLAVRAAGTVLSLKWGYGLLGLVIVTLACNVLACLGNWAIAHRIYPRLRVLPFALDRVRLRELLRYGLAIFVARIAFKLIGQTDLVIAGAAFGVSAVTVYSVGAMLIYYSGTFVGEISQVFFPPTQRAVARGDVSGAHVLFLRQVRLALIVGIPLFVGFIFFAEPFIRLWMLGSKFDESAVHTAAIVMGVLAGSKLLYLPCIGCASLLDATGHVRFNAILTSAEAICNLALSLFLAVTLRWGLPGIAMGTLLSRLLVGTFAHPWYACRKTGMDGKQFIIVAATASLVGIVFAGVCILVRSLFATDSWATFAIQVSAALLGYVPIAFWVLLPTTDRSRLYASFARSSAQQEA